MTLWDAMPVTPFAVMALIFFALKLRRLIRRLRRNRKAPE